MSVKLTDVQLVTMSAAGQCDDRCLAAPDTMKGAALSKVSAKLIKLGLVREIRAKAGMPVWGRDDAGQSYALKLTAGGLNAIAVEEAAEQAIEPSRRRNRGLSPRRPLSPILTTWANSLRRSRPERAASWPE
jgi:hypothetical protein